MSDTKSGNIICCLVIIVIVVIVALSLGDKLLYLIYAILMGGG